MDINELIFRMDEKYTQKGWNLWRCHDGEWCVQASAPHDLAEKGVLYESKKMPTLTEALNEALDWTPAIRLEPRPYVPTHRDYQVIKDCSKWALMFNGRFQCGNLKSKRYAEECINSQIAHAEAKAKAWDATVGMYVAAHRLGVDFIYKY